MDDNHTGRLTAARTVVIREKSMLSGLPELVDGSAVAIGGLKAGYSWREMLLAPESIHQNVNFSGYPLGGVTIDLWLFAPVEAICKAQTPVQSLPTQPNSPAPSIDRNAK